LRQDDLAVQPLFAGFGNFGSEQRELPVRVQARPPTGTRFGSVNEAFPPDLVKRGRLPAIHRTPVPLECEPSRSEFVTSVGAPRRWPKLGIFST
jgi:hypothetical protein